MLKIKTFTFNPFYENSYVIFNPESKEAIIVDPGCSNNTEEQELKAFIDQHKLKPVMLFNTHCHIDHILGNRWVRDQYKIDLIAHKEEEKVLDWSVSAASMYEILYNRSPAIHQYIDEGENLNLGGEEMELLHCPGHSPGSLCIVYHKSKWIVGGDVLFQGSIGRTDLPGGSYEVLESSIRNKLYQLPDDYIVYPGHGPETSLRDEKKYNAYVKEV
jgi:hydroxyacylglutathione hydrolase